MTAGAGPFPALPRSAGWQTRRDRDMWKPLWAGLAPGGRNPFDHITNVTEASFQVVISTEVEALFDRTTPPLGSRWAGEPATTPLERASLSRIPARGIVGTHHDGSASGSSRVPLAALAHALQQSIVNERHQERNPCADRS